MSRLLVATSLIALAAPAWAERFVAEARVDAVTLYPGQAGVTRIVELELPAGSHEIIVPDLPDRLDPRGLRLSAPEGVRLGAVTLARDRQPVAPDLDSAEVEAARAEVERLEDAIRAKTAEIEEIRLAAEAAEAQIAFLQALAANGGGDGRSLSDLREMATMAGGEMLRLKRAAFAAEQQAAEEMRAREELQEELEDARTALAELVAPQTRGTTLSFTVDLEEAGAASFEMSSVEVFATWRPAYDLRLDTGAGALELDRSVVISQATGRDWRDVELRLSTARPGERIAPSEVHPFPRRIVPEDQVARYSDRVALESAEAMAPMGRVAAIAKDEMAVADMSPAVDFSGAVVEYVYPGRVTIRDGVEELRLPLDSLDLDAEVRAEAVPEQDMIAYRVAELVNPSEEPLLPGEALLYADGTMIGMSFLPMLAAGADVEIGFGPLDGLRLERRVPERTEGDRGVFVRGNRWQERVELEVENLTGQEWDVVLREAVAFSEQDDLEVSVDATPPIDRRDPEGRRGIAEWDLTLAPGETRIVVVETEMKWPSDHVLMSGPVRPF